MNTSPQITSVEPTIRIPDWRSASPKNLKTRRPKISRKTWRDELDDLAEGLDPALRRDYQLLPIYFGIVVISGWVASSVWVNA